MDTGKVLTIANDIQKDEANFNFQSQFQSVLDHYVNGTFESIDKITDKIRQELITSPLEDYVLSDYEVLRTLGLEGYFGPDSHITLTGILELPAHQVRTRLQEFITTRQEALSKILNLKSSLEAIGITPRILNEDEYEIGFTIPGQYSDMQKFEEVVEDLRNFLDALSDSTGQPEPLKINHVSNGSIQLFLHTTWVLAKAFDQVLNHALIIYGTLKACNEVKKNFSAYKEKHRKNAEKAVDEQCKEDVDKQIEDLVIALGLDDPDKQNTVRGRFKLILKHLENGVAAEVKVPQIAEPVEVSSDPTATQKRSFQKSQEKYLLNEQIKKDSKSVFILQQNNFYGNSTKYLHEQIIEEDK